MPTANERAVIQSFLTDYFGENLSPMELRDDEASLANGVLGYVESTFSQAQYPLGLAIDFLLLAQQLAKIDERLNDFDIGRTFETIVGQFPIVESRGVVKANTLTLECQTSDGKRSFGIRRLEESVIRLFLELDRPGYPSSYVYATGQWAKFKDTLLVPAFRLSGYGRYRLTTRLIEFGLAKLTRGHLLGRKSQRFRLFESIVSDFPRGRHPNEKAGCMYQGIAAGYVKADRPHLFILVDKSRTGSARQHRIGDIDCYSGLDLEISIEVKDVDLDARNSVAQIGAFLGKAVANRVLGMVICRSATDEVVDRVRSQNCVVLTESLLLEEISRWDWQKQNAAVLGMIHFLAHIEQSPDALNRLLEYIREVDPTHESLLSRPTDESL